jgi:DNA polymerase sigma
MNNNFNQRKLLIISEILNEESYLRELCEKLKLPLTTIHAEITTLQKNNMLLTYFKKNKKFFKINYDSPLTREAIRIIFIEKIFNLKNFKQLIKEKGLLKIYLFGSANTGLFDKHSDIDLAIIVENEIYKNTIEKYRQKIHEEIGFNIDLITLTQDEFISLKDEKRQILINIQQGTLIYGNMFK